MELNGRLYKMKNNNFALEKYEANKFLERYGTK